jgi:hypothetical protein
MQMSDEEATARIKIIEANSFTDPATNPVFSSCDFRAVPEKYRTLITEYVKDFVSLNTLPLEWRI